LPGYGTPNCVGGLFSSGMAQRALVLKYF